MRVYLVGYMASGKSSLGRQLAAGLSFDFLDLDFLFEQKYRISIFDFFEKYGEDAFRRIETELLRDTTRYENAVIATGGGTPCFYGNMEFINASGISVYLHWEIPGLIERLKKLRRKRPLLKDIPDDRLEDYVTRHLASRISWYSRAHLVADGCNLEVDKLVQQIREREIKTANLL